MSLGDGSASQPCLIPFVAFIFTFKNDGLGIPLVVQWLRCQAPIARGPRFEPCLGN